MKKIIVISDSHGNKDNINEILSRAGSCDYIFFLGDGIGDTLVFPEDKLIAVKGNCDGAYNSEKVVDVDGVKIFLTHGHEYNVNESLLDLKFKAEELKANLVLFGHTHNAIIEEQGGITFINPGALKGDYINKGTYAYIIIEKGNIYPVICEI